MELKEYIIKRRKELNLSRNELAIKVGISHTEVHRIETGERKMPSLTVLINLANALNVPQEDILSVAGYSPIDNTSPINKVFPTLNDKGVNTINKIATSLARNPELKGEDLEKIYEQVEMIISYAQKKNTN